MLERLWTSILELTAQFVTPDWGKLIAVIPVIVAIVVLIILILVIRALRKAPPARRGKQPLPPRQPAGLHMPGPSFSPAFAAMGTFLTLLGLVFGGLVLVLGILALVLTLLYWLAEGIRVYDHDNGPVETALPAVIETGPPPGVHLPGPSWQPFLGAFGVFLLFLGLVFGDWLLAVGVIALISTLVGWLTAAIQEYRLTVQADTTGHLSNPPAPRVPTRLLTVLGALTLGAVVLQVSVFGNNVANGGTAGASGAPPASGSPAASGQPPASGGPAPSGPTADVSLTAHGIQFQESSFTAPANKPFSIAFHNEDAGTPHNVELQDGSGKVVFRGEVFNGVDTRVYAVPAQPAGAYKFSCVVHPTMTGTATIQ